MRPHPQARSRRGGALEALAPIAPVAFCGRRADLACGATDGAACPLAVEADESLAADVTSDLEGAADETAAKDDTESTASDTVSHCVEGPEYGRHRCR